MPMNEFEFRTATPDDAGGIAQVLEVFGSAPKTPDQLQHHLESIRETAHQWRIAVQADEIIAAAHASPSDIWFGRSRIKWADIGEVSVLKSRQGEGIGTLVMADMVRWLKETGFGISRLGGLLRFYSRFGYQPFPRCYVEFPISDVIRAGASKVPFTSLLEPAFPGAGHVRLFDEVRDVPQVWRIIENFTRHRTGCRAFEQPITTPHSTREACVYESGGQVRGIMTFREFEADMSPFEASLMIYQLAYDVDCSAALDGLIKHVLKRAHQKQATRVTAFLPFTDDVTHDLDRIGISYTLCEHKGAVAGNMVQIASLRALLEQIQPELQARVAHLNWNGGLTIDLGDQQAGLQMRSGHVDISEPVEGGIPLQMNHAELCRTILGVLPPVWPRLINPADDVCPVLQAIFPPVRGGYCS